MPGGDRTGPNGMGAMSGRGAGFCAGYRQPGFANPIPGGRGLGLRRGNGGGFGRGRGGGRGMAWGVRGFMPPQAEIGVAVTEKEAKEALERQQQMLEQELQAVRDRLGQTSDNQ